MGADYVNWIHDDLIGSLWPEIDPVSTGEYRSIELLESALGRPFQSAGGQYLYPTTIEKASALFHSLIANHPFYNGNKRTAVIAVDAFLMGNGYTVTLDNKGMYELAQQTASYRKDGISHDDSLRKIIDILNGCSVPLTALYHAQRKNRTLAKFYHANLFLRRSVRRHLSNKLIKL